MLRNFFSGGDPTPVDDQIVAVMESMATLNPNSKEFDTHMAHLRALIEMKTATSRKPVSSDTIALCATNLFGIFLIVLIDQRHIFSPNGLRERIRPKGL